MDNSLLRWIGDEALLQQFVAGLSTPVLLLIIVACIALLSKGADWMIDGVVDLAERTGLPKIVIGATVVSLGTTLPEAFVYRYTSFHYKCRGSHPCALHLFSLLARLSSRSR